MASSQRRLIATAALVALLAVGFPTPGFPGGSDEPGYTGGSRSTGSGGSGGSSSGSGSSTTSSQIDPIDPEPLVTQSGTEAAQTLDTEGVLGWLITSWLELGATLMLR